MVEFPIVLVKNLPYNASTSLLFDIFSKFGPVHQLRISDGLVPQGTCYVVYTNMENAHRAAKELNGVNFQSRYLVAHMFQVDPEVHRQLQIEFEKAE